MTRIAILTNEYSPYPGGVGRYCSELAEAAAARGLEVAVFAPSYGSEKDELSGPVQVYRYPGGVFDTRMLSFWRLRKYLKGFLAKHPFDIVHAADWPMIIALNLIRPKGERRIATIYGSDVSILWTARRARLLGSRKALRKFDYLTVISRFSAKILHSRFAERTLPPVTVVPLGVSPEWFEPVPKPSGFRARFETEDEQKFLIVTVARIEKRKGHRRLVEAIARLPQQQRKRVVYLLIGKVVDQTVMNEITSAAAAGGVELHHLGRVSDDELRHAYADSDLFALPAQDDGRTIEGFGLVLLEAAAQGLPSLVTRVHAVPEVVIDGQTGWITAAADEKALSDTLRSILSDPMATSRMRSASVEQARRYSWDACARATYE